jgi:hypothetical protein
MINFITHATALLAIAKLSTAATIRANDYDNRQGLRKLYNSDGHEVTDVQTKCDCMCRGDIHQERG